MAENQQNSTGEGVATIPACLEKASLEEIFRKVENCDDFEITKLEVISGSNIGDNYLSIMYAVDMEAKKCGQTTSYAVMAKVIPSNPLRQEMLAQLQAFVKELRVYQDLLPVFAKLQADKGLADQHVFSAYPKFYYGMTDGKKDFILMENLKVSGFRMADRINGLDYPQCRLVVTELAKLHATSYVLAQGNGKTLQERFPYLEEAFSDVSKNLEGAKFMDQIFIQVLEKVQALGGYESTVAWMKRLLETPDGIMGAIRENIKKVEDGMAVITHGDCWVNNILFKFDEEETPQEVKLVDYQISRIGSRTLDLGYLFCTSTTGEMRDQHQDDLFQDYHNTFVSCLHEAGVDASKFTLEGLLKEYNEHFAFGFIFACVILPMIITDAAEIPDMETLTKEDMENFQDKEKFKKFYKNPRLMTRIIPILKEVKKRIVL